MNQLLIRVKGRLNTMWSGYDEYARNRFHILVENIFNNITGNLVGGNFLTGLLLYLQAGSVLIGLVNMIVFACNTAQILSPLFLSRFASRKRLLVIARAVIHIMNVVLISLIAVIPAPERVRVIGILGMVAALNLVSALMGQGYAVWHMKSVPLRERASFFSIQHRVVNVAVYVTLLASSFVIDHFKAAGMELTGLMLVRAVALIFAALDVYWLTRIREYPIDGEGEPLRLKSVFTIALARRDYLPSVLIGFLWNFFANTTGPFFTVYLLSELGVSYAFLNMCTAMYVPCVLLLTPLWTRLVRRSSWLGVFYKALFFYSLAYATHALVTDKWPWFYIVVALLCYFISPGINVIMANMAYHRLPVQKQTVYLTFHATFSNIGAILGVSFATAFMSVTGGLQLQAFGILFTQPQILTLVTAALLMALSVIVFFLHRRDAAMPPEEESCPE